MNIHELTVDEALASLRSQRLGLSTSEALERTAEFGHNLLPRGKKSHPILEVLKEFTGFLAIILWIAAVLAFWTGLHDPTSGMSRLGWAILAVIIINGLFSYWQVFRANRAINALEKMLPQSINVRRDDVIKRLPTPLLVPGDVILLEAGDRVPADARILAASRLKVNQAALTGESRAQSRNSEPSHDQNRMEAANLVWTGSEVVSGKGEAVVFATGHHTEFGKIAASTLTQSPEELPLQKEIKRLSRFVAAFATLLGFAFFSSANGSDCRFGKILSLPSESSLPMFPKDSYPPSPSP